MKIVALLNSAVNVCLGGRCLLNVVGVHSSKYSPVTTAIFAVLYPQ